MKKKICVYTCITGDYDNLKEISNVEENIDYYCFTNNKKIKSKTWNIIYIDDNSLSNVLLARKIKILGSPLINEKYDIEMWMDASVEFKKNINEFIKEYMSKEDIFVCFKHGERNSIKEEMDACLRFRKEDKKNIENLMDFYNKEKYKYDNGLIESTVFIRKTNNKLLWETMELWFSMVKNYTKRDQLSFNYCLFKTGLNVKYINKKVFDNEWFECFVHSSNHEISSYSIYYGNISENYDYKKHFIGKYKIEGNKYFIDEVISEDTDRLDIEIVDVPLTKGRLINTNIKNGSIFNLNSVDFNGWKVFYNNLGLIVIFSKFKKGDKLKLVFEFQKMKDYENLDLITNLIEKMVSFELKEKATKMRLDEMTNKYKSIINSKSWKITNPLRKIKRRISKKK